MTRSRKLLTDDHAAMNTPGESFRPSNGTEGEMFMERWCHQCVKDINGDCNIITDAMMFDIDDHEYPRAWIHDATGQPSCTAFQEIGVDPAIKPAPGQLSLFGGES
jgi:hypothetical protein